jgi:hypothetical protein
VLPPEECPHGYSLTAMGAAVAPFTTSGSNPALYPDTPFQILYVDEMDVEMVGDRIVLTGSNVFTVAAGTVLHVSIFGGNDYSPPIVSDFPTIPSQAPSYLCDPEHYGAEFEIDIDGTSTALGPEYVTGPVPTLGTERGHIVTLGAFLGPLSPGIHVATIRGSVSGRGFAEAYGVSSLHQTLTYTIEVIPSD